MAPRSWLKRRSFDSTETSVSKDTSEENSLVKVVSLNVTNSPIRRQKEFLLPKLSTRLR